MCGETDSNINTQSMQKYLREGKQKKCLKNLKYIYTVRSLFFLNSHMAITNFINFLGVFFP